MLWRLFTMAFRLRMTNSWPAGRESRRNSTRTSYITREWKTRRISVINSTTNGKKDRIELAATENAKVCTSVRSRYLTVETSTEGRGRRGRSAGPGSRAGGGAGVGGVCSGMGRGESYQGFGPLPVFRLHQRLGPFEGAFLVLR